MAVAAIDLTLLVDLGMVLVFATIFSYLARVLKQPSLLAYLVAGLVLGPIGLGAMNLSIGGLALGVKNVSEILILSELGIAFLLFSVGVESDFSKLRNFGRFVLVGGFLQVLLTALFVFLASQYFGFLAFREALYVGMIVAFSSTLIVVKMLSDSHEINTLHGRLLIGFLLVQDLLVILAMPMLANLGQILNLQLILPVFAQGVFLILFAFLLNKFVYPKLFGFALQSEELLYLAAVSCCFIFIGLAYALNFSIAVGAFIAGLSLSTLPSNLEVYNKIRGLRDFFATIFFVTLGMQISFAFGSIPLGLMLVILGSVFLLKPLLIYSITLLSGFGSKVSFAVAVALAQVSEFSFILLSQGRPVLDSVPGLYSFLLLVIAASMGISPYLIHYSGAMHSLAARFLGRFLKPFAQSPHLCRRLSSMESVPKNMRSHIVIVGGGTMGFSVAAALNGSIDLVVVDHDSERVFKCIGRGINAIYGSAGNTDIMRKVNLKEAKLLILAIPDAKSTLFLIKYAKGVNPGIVVFARAHFCRDALAFYNSGADFVVMPHIIGSNTFLREVAKFLETGNVSYISNYRDEFMKYLEENVEEEGKQFRR